MGIFSWISFYNWLLACLKRSPEKRGIDQNKIFWLAILIFLFSILGARLGYFFQFKVNGLMFYGGFFSTLIVSWFI